MSGDERDLDELLGAYALDAVSPDERRRVDEYLLVDPRARAEVREHREVASLLAWTGATAPEGLWDRISDQLEERAPAPSGELAAVLAFDATGAGRRSTRRSSTGRRRWQPAFAWVTATAAAAAIAVFAVSVIDRDGSRSPMLEAVDAARKDRDSMVTMLMDEQGTVGGEAIVDVEGHGYLLVDRLPQLPSDRTYQLWGEMDGRAISLGVLGNHPGMETFTAEGHLTKLMITNEVAGGVVSDGNPEGAFVATMG